MKGFFFFFLFKLCIWCSFGNKIQIHEIYDNNNNSKVYLYSTFQKRVFQKKQRGYKSSFQKNIKNVNYREVKFHLNIKYNVKIEIRHNLIKILVTEIVS